MQSAKAIWQANRADRFQGYICAVSPPTIYYIARKQTQDAQRALELITQILRAFYVSAVDQNILQQALTLHMTDFEDAIQAACAQVDHLDFIITRNVKDYLNARVKALTPEEFIAQIT
ncbi:MAG: hypothetical protein OHK0052_07270 [Anaerolineales bacterium]